LDDVGVLRQGDQHLHLHHNVLSSGDRRGGGVGGDSEVGFPLPLVPIWAKMKMNTEEEDSGERVWSNIV
jgi:hypothetical protein